MNIKKLSTKFIVFVLLFIGGAFVEAQDFKLIEERVAETIIEGRQRYASKTRISEYLNSMQADGAWADVNYNDKTRTAWSPSEHLSRIELMAIAYVLKDNFYYESPELLQAIQKGLLLWDTKRPRSDNWWHNEIGSPKRLGQILIVMGTSAKSLSRNVQNKIIALMERTLSPSSSDKRVEGANKIDIAMHNLYRAVVLEDAQLMRFSTRYLFEPIELVNNGAGIQYDYSYHQHGPQLYTSSYGAVFFSGSYKVAYWVYGTPYALPQEKAEILNKFFFDSYVSGIRGQFMDFNLEGRAIARPDALKKEFLADGDLLKYVGKVAGEKYTNQLDALRKRLLNQEPSSYDVTSGHIYYWKGDYTLHKRPKYSFNVRAVSNRTMRTERGNNENKLGTTLPDGSTNIQVNGDEYYNIMPVWEWDKIPGTTSKNYHRQKEIKGDWGQLGTTSFVGGVSDGLYGAMVYTQDYDGVTAKKSYFFFDDAVVCLGSDIAGEGSEEVVTTVNQTLSKGDVYLLKDGNINQAVNNGKIEADAVWHNQVAYIFPESLDLYLSNQNQTGNWNRINTRFNKPAEEKVFKLWLSQGNKPRGATYSYIVLPALEKNNLKEKYSNLNIEIIRNDQRIQAVQDKGLKITQIVFYESGTLDWGDERISVDNPCVVQLRYLSDKEFTLSVADPTQSLNRIKVTYTKSGVEYNKSFILPEAQYSGKTVTENMKVGEMPVDNPEEELKKILISNVFTPNGDSVNETWKIVNITDYPNNKVQVFDKNGRLVFSRKSYKNDWAGIADNGKKLPQGSYIYVIDLGNGRGIHKGWLYINY